MKKKIPVLVTTQHRGVFFGLANPDLTRERIIELTDCRNCLYWSRDTGGFLGLASHGPTNDCRVGKLAPLPVILHDITSVSHCTPEAAERWKAA